MVSGPSRVEGNGSGVLVETAAGVARVTVDRPPTAPRGVVVLGHGAGGDLTAPVLVGVAAALVAAGLVVARFDQPYRVAGRRAPPRSPVLDAAALDVLAWLRADPAIGARPLVVGGKSSGARVASRVARANAARGVVALGFPLRPPGRPDVTRADELRAAGTPVLVCQGTRDTFGSPREVEAATRGVHGVTVHAVAGGDHSFVPRRADGRTREDCLVEVARVVTDWVLRQVAAT